MIHGRKPILPLSALSALGLALALSSCAGKQTRAPDCFACTEQTQQWSGFQWKGLEGSWKGSLETVTNIVTAPKKDAKEDAIEVRFIDGQKFLQSVQAESCGGFPAQAVVFMGQLWREQDEMTGLNLATGKVELPENQGRFIASQGSPEAKVYEVFGADSQDQVLYGRATVSRVNGKGICTFSRVDGKFFQNRLALPSLNFSKRVTRDGRVLASGTTPEYEISLEFLDYKPNGPKQEFTQASARKPASVAMHDQPQLFLRVFKIARNIPTAYGRGEWTGTREYLYRLWRNQ